MYFRIWVATIEWYYVVNILHQIKNAFKFSKYIIYEMNIMIYIMKYIYLSLVSVVIYSDYYEIKKINFVNL